MTHIADRAAVAIAHERAAAKLRLAGTLGGVPTTFDVRAELARIGHELTRETVLALCAELHLALADAGPGT